MQDRKFTLAIASFPYGGNGGMKNEYPGVRDFLIEVARKTKGDPRIADVFQCDFSDTPITMTRNQAVTWARQVEADFLLMIDSDMQPDCERRDDPEAKPFWDTSWDFVMQHYDKGPNVVCAPYCGPPPISNVYAFYWALDENDCPNDKGRIVQYTREEASRMVGIQPCAAQPTGLILFDMRAFDLTDPLKFYNELRAKGRSREEALALVHPWFYYEWEDVYHSQKASTEDVTATRDMSFHGWLEYGRDTIYTNWDAWAGHVKPKVVRKPRPLDAKTMHAQYRCAVELKQTNEAKMVFIGAGENSDKPPFEQSISHALEEQQFEERMIVVPPDDGIDRIGSATPYRDTFTLTALISQFKPKLVVEIGSWVGESALAICKGLSPSSKLVCIDHFLGSPGDGSGTFATRVGSEKVKETFLRNTKAYRESGQLTLWDVSNNEALKIADSKVLTIDFLWLDANHEYDFVKHQILDWSKFMAEDGIIAGHDFDTGFPGVERAVRELFCEFTHIPDTAVWYAKVCDLRQPQNGKVYEHV
jgi:hypothetical protein